MKNNSNIFNIQINELNTKLEKLKLDRKDYLETKSISIKKLMSCRKLNSEILNESNLLVEDLKEIDREVKGLEQIILTSMNLATSIIQPICDREKSIINITKTVELLNVENDIKELLKKIKNDKSTIENKINIILQASSLINSNHLVFDSYREQFLKESQDVLNHLHSSFNDMKSKLFNLVNSEGKLNVKECNCFINEIDKNCILTYKLTNNIEKMNNFFTLAADYIISAVCKNKINEYLETSNSFNNISSDNTVKIKDMLQSISKNLILKIFLKISSMINERKLIYFNEFNNFDILNIFIEKILINIENSVEKLISIVITITEKILKDSSILCANINTSNDLDFLCGEQIAILSNLEKFKFFVTILIQKISLNHIKELNINSHRINNHSNLPDYFKKLNSLLYDLGEKYANTEIKFMKNKLSFLFKDESKKFSQVIEKNINCKYDELAGTTLNCIDDLFYILKISGARAIASMNLQLSLAIVNNIKSILTEELIELLDIKISAVLIKTENRINNPSYQDIKYSCKEEPNISYKFTHPNLYFISCINSIDQSRNNISILMDELKYLLNFEIIQSQAFNHSEIILGINKHEEDLMNQNIQYFNKNEVDLVNITFSDVETLIQRYDDFLTRKLKIGFEYLYPHIKSSVDLLNSVNYLIDGKNIQSSELSESFSTKFIEETDKILKQWKTQLSEGSFNKFLTIYSEYVSIYIEKLLFVKAYSTYGVIVLEKDINKIVNYFQNKVTISIREKFNRLISIVKVLNFESREELIDYIRNYNDIKLSKNEIEIVRKLRKEI